MSDKKKAFFDSLEEAAKLHGVKQDVIKGAIRRAVIHKFFKGKPQIVIRKGDKVPQSLISLYNVRVDAKGLAMADWRITRLADNGVYCDHVNGGYDDEGGGYCLAYSDTWCEATLPNDRILPELGQAANLSKVAVEKIFTAEELATLKKEQII